MPIMVDLHSPIFDASNPQRTAQCRRETEAVARRIVLDMVAAGWRESEAALALADAFDDYCIYLAKRPVTTLVAANSNQFAVRQPRLR
ncbi:hypothetical protein IHQ71_04335 [Rhizobium sp. TH2]|uniref:hypothetical protein n=1 Tax=Rhizobium sp. TH2 TaxID=2775403 RepID=UPI00220C1041|nr:hypothetical protein IHQ71_04335 [Rhizobium sp. TH2]